MGWKRALRGVTAASLGAVATLWATEGAAAGCRLEKIVELPVTMAGGPLAPAKINGADVRLIVDSGAFYSLISPAVAARLRLPTSYAYTNPLVRGVGGTVDAGVARVATFSLGGQTLRGVEFLVAGNGLGPSAGLLGQNVLGFADTEYDLANGVVRLWRPVGCGGRSLAYWAKGDQPFGEVDLESSGEHTTRTIGPAYLDGVRLRAAFDTGGGASFVTRAGAKRAGIDPDAAGSKAAGQVMGGIGLRSYEARSVPVVSFKVGGEQINNTRLLVGDSADLGIDMWLGVDFFLAHRVYVANSQHRLYFTYNGGPVFDFSAARTGLANSAPPEPPVGNTDADGLARRAAALLARGDVTAAVAEYTRARAAAPDNAEYALGRAQAHLAEKNARLARADLDDAIRLDPRQVGARVVRARLAIREHDKAAALVDLDAADKAMPKEADTRLILGDLYIAMDLFAPAIRQFDQWLESHPSDIGRARALNGRCWARALANESLGSALADCNAALRARRDPNILDSRGLVHLRLGQWDAAIADYDATLATLPKSPWSLYGRGIAELRLGRKDAGQTDIKAAAALAPDLPARAKSYGVTP